MHNNNVDFRNVGTCISRFSYVHARAALFIHKHTKIFFERYVKII